ncbi:hypothetical protein M899_2801 [Bacteriovorax sp. BSW11_IV]|uniref:hypothetical protein n=1 Tax=Bacteriovorax sp. BSW11_IV TaxID=1353529 RepID=UPI000389F17A|nr:hypothetical protein [Bacteriovorax sp. BSW11_IV]EQC48216.1 hypothetical protein M899_2801 [Bacteriovorax sp. BSW11_IV]
MKLLALLSLMLTSPMAADFKFETVTKVGPLKNQVFFESTDYKFLDENADSLKVERFMISKWGVHVYQVGKAIYNCNITTLECSFSEFVRERGYELCTIEEGAPKCVKPLSAPSYEGQDNNNSTGAWYEWELDDGQSTWYGDEFPTRDEGSANCTWDACTTF